LPLPAAAITPSAFDPASVAEIGAFREKRFHRVGEVNVAYREIGDGEPVVLLHGMAGAESWNGVAQHLMAGRRLLIPEILGISDTAGPGSADFTLMAEAARIRGLLSALDIPSAHIVGNELGGVVAQIFAVRWPGCVKTLVLSNCDSLSGWPPRFSADLTAPGVLLAARHQSGTRILSELFHDLRFVTPERVRKWAQTVAGTREKRMRLRRFLRSLKDVDIRTINQLLADIRVPTIVIWGADDQRASVSWAKTLYDSIPGARRLELIPFCGSACHEERPEVFGRAIAQFYRECDPELRVEEEAPPLTKAAGQGR
jgi:pimeloyl-ACP methyl ester carboxylesterase